MGYYDPSGFINKSLPKFNQLNAPQTSGVFSNILDNMYKSQQIQRENDLHPLVKILKEQEIKGKQADIAQTNIDNQSKQLDLNIKQDQYNDRQQAIDWVNILKQDPSNYSSDDQIAMIDHNPSLSAGAKSLARQSIINEMRLNNDLKNEQSTREFFDKYPNYKERLFQERLKNESSSNNINTQNPYANLNLYDLKNNSNQTQEQFNQSISNAEDIIGNTVYKDFYNPASKTMGLSNVNVNDQPITDISKDVEFTTRNEAYRNISKYLNDNLLKYAKATEQRANAEKYFNIATQKNANDFFNEFLQYDNDGSLAKELFNATQDGTISQRVLIRASLIGKMLDASYYRNDKQLREGILRMLKGEGYEKVFDGKKIGGHRTKEILKDLDNLFSNYERILKEKYGVDINGSANGLPTFNILDKSLTTGKDKDKIIAMGTYLDPEIFNESIQEMIKKSEKRKVDEETIEKLKALDPTDYSWIPYSRY